MHFVGASLQTPQHGKYKASSSTTTTQEESQQDSYNDRKAQATQLNIKQAMERLQASGELPSTITARFHALTQEHIGGRSLYRYKELWHPKFDQQRSEKSKIVSVNEEPPFQEGSSSFSTSLLGQHDGNSPHREDFSDSEGTITVQQVGNTLYPLSTVASDGQQAREQRFLRLREQFVERMAQYLQGDDSIFIQEALDTVAAQPQLLGYELIQQAVAIAAQKDQVSLLLAVFELLLRLQWTPQQIQRQLHQQFGKQALFALLPLELRLFYQTLGALERNRDSG